MSGTLILAALKKVERFGYGKKRNKLWIHSLC
jgi:hypothetical protein